MKKETLMVDMDDVITYGNFFNLIQEFLNKKIKLDDVKTYWLQDLIKDRKEEFWNWVKDKNFYDNSELMPNCYEVLEKLNMKYDLYIVTAYLWNETVDLSGKNLQNKYYFLKEKLPFIKPEQYIFTTNKLLCNFDIRIDDRLYNLEGAKKKIMFEAWHNREYSDEELRKNNVIKVRDWKEIAEILL